MIYLIVNQLFILNTQNKSIEVIKIKHEFNGKIDWINLPEKNSLEPTSGFVISKDNNTQTKEDFILNKLWDILHDNLGKSLTLKVEIKS